MFREDELCDKKRENYREDVKVNDIKLTGINEKCVFNSVNGFHILKKTSCRFHARRAREYVRICGWFCTEHIYQS